MEEGGHGGMTDFYGHSDVFFCGTSLDSFVRLAICKTIAPHGTVGQKEQTGYFKARSKPRSITYSKHYSYALRLNEG